MISRREFIATGCAAGLAAIGGFALAGCSNSRSNTSSTSSTSSSSSSSSSSKSSESSSGESSKATTSAATASSLVVYFSHTGENYAVGVIEEGNTAVIASMIAQEMGADMFEIVPTEDYPSGYDDCCDVALAEQDEQARPTYIGDIDLSAYDTVYLGYPIWWGDLPMVVYTFIENHDWQGKTVRPFDTHGGSGLADTVSTISTLCEGATVGEGLAIEGTTAQNDRTTAQTAVTRWLG